MKKTTVVLCMLALLTLALAARPAASLSHQTQAPFLSAARPTLPAQSGAVLSPAQRTSPFTGEDTLHVDGPYNNNALGFGGAMIWYAAARLTPIVTCTLSAVIFYQRDASVNDYVFVWGPGSNTEPGAVLDSIPYDASGTEQWKRVELNQRIALPAGTDVWVGPRINQAQQCWPLGIDAGPAVAERGDWFNYAGAWVETRNNAPPLDYNFNIRAIVSHGTPPAHDVAALAVVAPVGWTEPVPVTPKVSIKNFGANPESGIPVTCWIDDSEGTRVYDETDTCAGPLAPNATAQVSFSPDWTGILGIYNVTMFVSQPGDSSQYNDTAKGTVGVVSTVWQRIRKPTSPDRLVQSVAYCPLNDRIYMVGGNPEGLPGTNVSLNQEYNPAKDSWKNRASMPTARGWATATYARGKIYVIGGMNNSNAAIANNEAYDVVANTWSTKAPRPNVLLAPLAGAWRDSLIYVMGGIDTFYAPYISVDVYDVVNNTWSTASDLPQAAAMGSCAIVGDTIYIADAAEFTSGGQAAAWTNLRKGAIDPADPSTITWIDGGATPAPVAQGATAAVNGAVYWLGGRVNLSTTSSSMWKYDIATGAITEFAPPFPITVARCNYMAARVSNNELYVMAGDSGGDWSAPNHYYAKMAVGPAAISSQPALPRVATGLWVTPNPVHNLGRISYQIGEPTKIDIGIYDVSGALVRRLARGQMSAGAGTITWNRTSDQGRRVSSGIYFCRLTTPNLTQSGKLVVTD